MNYVFSKKKPEIGDRGFIVGDRFISIQQNIGKIPEDYIFYDSLKTRVDKCQTGQTRSGSANEYDLVIKNIPCSYFNGNHIYYTGLSLQNNQSYSISIWVNNQKYPVTDIEEGFCSLSSSSIRKRITFCSRVDSTTFYADAIGIPGEGYRISNELLNLGDWYHLVGIVDVLSKEVIFYKNGKLIERGTYEHWNNGNNYSGTSGFIIGNLCSWNGYESMYQATAYISSVRIYNRVINKTEVLALFKEFQI